MENDDHQVGRILTRREMLSLLAGMGGAVLLAACDPGGSNTAQSTATAARSAQATGTPLNQEAQTAVAASPVGASPTADTASVPDCVVRPELTEGPYFVDEKLNRSDIRPDPSNNSVSEGVPLALAFVVSQVGTGSCVPLKDAQVDVWHCDALGVYSDVQGSTGTKFLRGYQLTDANGKASFTTIYPGWYRGRAVHIHFKIRTTSSAGQSYEFTSQFFFDDALSDQVYTQQPYAQHTGRDTLNSSDNIYQGGGNQLLLSLTKSADGYTTTFPIGLDLSDTQTGGADGGSQGPGGPGGPP
ncbi:MAG TPA: intradiol ring-cleavage dioxygenase [Chloroflexia bacterium]|nr:intradiol ring-cleavage dioxygenase [Chloroflexia bacterium]